PCRGRIALSGDAGDDDRCRRAPGRSRRRARAFDQGLRRRMSAPTIYVTGNVNVDLIMGPLGQWPKVGTEIVLPHSEIRIGGAAGNTALALAALGAPHRLIASVGDDIFGRWLQSGFAAADWAVAEGATTVSVGIVDPGGRSEEH